MNQIIRSRHSNHQNVPDNVLALESQPRIIKKLRIKEKTKWWYCEGGG